MNVRASEVLPYIVAALFLLVVTVYYAQFLNNGPLRHYDEYLTLDRSAGFRANGDWATVFGNNRPTFNKPPLQYWISAGLLAAGVSPEVATRLPSFVFGLGVLALSGLLALCLIPTRPWAVPAAMLLVASSLKFWLSALSALLDTGAIFFAYLALIGVLLALKEPRWWYLVASACVLGAMQKIPLGIAFAAAPIAVLAVSERWTGAPVKPILRTREFRIALAVTLIGTLAWPVLQTIRHGFAGLREPFYNQILYRISPFREPVDNPKSPLVDLLFGGEAYSRVLGMAATFWLPYRTQRWELWALPLLCTLYAVMMSTAGGFVSARYSLFLLPMLMAALAAAIMSILPRPSFQLLAVIALVAMAGGPFKPTQRLAARPKETVTYVPFLQRLQASILPGETLLDCASFDRAARLYPGALAYYGSAGKPYYTFRTMGELKLLMTRDHIRPPFRGVCTSAHFQSLTQHLVNPRSIETFGGLTHWSADAIK